ncbi:MAG: CocE/NonD family hydrolase [Candidatus Hydrogenedentes bacterium]|nr:CocE/NonD family hydrolase [Candidatus Hydrogenedentota bacterium]
MLRIVMTFLLAATISLTAAHAKTKRILIVGDSWAMSLSAENHDGFPASDVFDQTLAENGLADVETQGKVTAWGGRKASQWAKPENLALITQELTAYPSIDIVHLIIGGNDFLTAVQDPAFITKTPEERAAVWDGIKANVKKIVDTCLAVRNTIRVVIADYDYLDPVAAAKFWHFDFHGATVTQLNQWFVELGNKKKEIADATDRCEYLNNWGVLQYWFGAPAKSVTLPGGDINSPMPAGISPDGIHPNDAAHKKLLENAINKFYKGWLKTSVSGVDVDGAVLATDYYLPGAGTYPVILARTPYGKATLGNASSGEARKWLQDGYAFVAQDIRGTNGSTGTGAQLFESDGWGEKRDADATVQWILAQPWCNGKVGTVGFSAPGVTSMLAASACPDLSSQIIENACCDFYSDFVYQGGVFRKSDVMSLPWDNTGTWRSHPSKDTYWNAYDGVAHAPETTSSGFLLTGWFDMFQKGAIEGFMARQHSGAAGATGKQHLVIDPRTHAGGMGQLTFPSSDLPGGRTAARRTFQNYYMKNTGAGLGFTVKYYIMGASDEAGAPGNEWRTANDWPPFPTTARVYRLGTSERLASGEQTLPTGSYTFAFDPANPVPTLGGANLALPAGPMDQRAIGARNDILKFYTEPLAAPLEVTGHVLLRLQISSTAVDTDFTAKLVDVYPDGREMLFLDGIQRVKYRDSFETPSLLTPGTSDDLTIDLWYTSLVFNTGHRIGIHVSSSNFPRFEVNPNNGQDLPDPAKAPLVIANNTVYVGGAHLSALELPIPSSFDQDGDGLSESQENNLGTDPSRADTDADGTQDGSDTFPLNPRGASDSDSDGIGDEWEYRYFGNLSAVDGTSDYDGNGETDLAAFLTDKNPLENIPVAVDRHKVILSLVLLFASIGFGIILQLRKFRLGVAKAGL